MINEKLTPYERKLILNNLGFRIRQSSGQVNSIKNIAYEDEKGDFCVNLDTGQIKDWGREEYNGDIISYTQKVINKDFKESVIWIEKIVKRKLLTSGFDGMKQAELMYGAPPEKIEKEEIIEDFWNEEKRDALKKCISVLRKRGIPDQMKYIEKYDGIDLETLLEFNCGIYGFGDFELGLSGRRYNKDVYFIFPYGSGAMLYRRKEDGKKDVRNVKGSNPKESFFGINKEIEKSSLLFIMKSPRECMSFTRLMRNLNFNIIGICTGETISEITNNQKKQILELTKENNTLVYIFTDCDKPDSFEKTLVFGRILDESIKNGSIIHFVNIHKQFNSKIKDFTDIIQKSMKKGFWKKNENGYMNLEEDLFKKLHKAIETAEPII